ncbi:hypothetical protein LCGC14_1042330 [marine sediment metagenome]|uniref:Uncharacterized protein n=1 Tax=marine sediment metagenome TaxID=412755 RepID=A0A0F9ND23_9ZZZZ
MQLCDGDIVVVKVDPSKTTADEADRAGNEIKKAVKRLGFEVEFVVIDHSLELEVISVP